jgi:hypothetical protein
MTITIIPCWDDVEPIYGNHPVFMKAFGCYVAIGSFVEFCFDEGSKQSLIGRIVRLATATSDMTSTKVVINFYKLSATLYWFASTPPINAQDELGLREVSQSKALYKIDTLSCIARFCILM